MILLITSMRKRKQDKHLHVHWLARYPQEPSHRFALQAVFYLRVLISYDC